MSASAASSENTVKKIYQTVIEEVITNIREAFLDEGYDEQLLQELKQMWEAKLNASRAVQPNDDVPSSSSNETSGNMRLPTQATNNPREHAASNHAVRNGQHQTIQNQSGIDTSNVDIKPGIQFSLDAHTRSAIQALPQSYQNQERLKKHLAPQVDGGVDGDGSSSEEDDDDLGDVNDDDDNDDADDKNNDDQNEYEGKEDPDPLNSEDDLTEPGSPNSNSDLFETDHVIVCQYDKVKLFLCYIYGIKLVINNFLF